MSTLDGRITDASEYGKHILLTCENHPELRWTTKNISYIGARSIFYVHHDKNGPTPEECDCSTALLRVVEESCVA